MVIIGRTRSFRQFSLIFLRDFTLSSRRSYQSSDISQLLQKSPKCRRNIKISRKSANSAAWLEIPRPAEKCRQWPVTGSAAREAQQEAETNLLLALTLSCRFVYAAVAGALYVHRFCVVPS